MNEKELVVLLAETDNDVNLLLKAVGENLKGNLQFKKMKLRRLIKKDLKFDFMEEVFYAFRDWPAPRFGDFELPMLLKHSVLKNVSKMLQYLVVKRCHPEFVNEKFDKIIENAEGGYEPFYGLHGFDNDHDFELFYQNDDILQALNVLTDVEYIVKWFEDEIVSLDMYRKRLIDVDLSGFDALINTKNLESELLLSYSFLEKKNYSTSNVSEAAISNLRRVIDIDGVSLAIYLAYTEVGVYSEETKIVLLDKMQKQYLTFRMKLMDALKLIDTEIYRENNLALIKQYEDLIADVNELDHTNKIQHKEFAAKLDKERVEKEQYIKNIEAIKNDFSVLKNKMVQQGALEAGYAAMLSDDFRNLEIVVIYNSQLLYAPLIYPDVKFVDITKATNAAFAEAKLVLIPNLGGSIKQKRQVEEVAKGAGCEVLGLQCGDERQLIVAISQTINERGTC